MKPITILALVLVLASSAAASSDQSKKGDKGKGKGKGNDVRVSVIIGNEDRDVVREYFVKKHGRGNCPPGLAKKKNGCMPPGQAKKRYTVGRPLARDVVYVDPPAELVVRLKPSPSGYKYVVVDGDLVRLAIGTRMVVDAIDGLIH